MVLTEREKELIIKWRDFSENGKNSVLQVMEIFDKLIKSKSLDEEPKNKIIYELEK